MHDNPDLEVLFEFNGVRHGDVYDGYRPSHLIRDNYLTSGTHHYYDVDRVASNGTAKGTITLITPEAYPSTCWVGKRISVHEGKRIVGVATILKIFNEVLIDQDK